MCECSKSRFKHRDHRRLDSASTCGYRNSGGINVHFTCTMLIKLSMTIVFLIVTQSPGNVTASLQNSETTNSLGDMSSESDIHEHFIFNKHRQNPTFYKQGHIITLHQDAQDRNSHHKDAKSGHTSKSGFNKKQNLKVDLDSSSKCIITVISESDSPTFHNCNCSGAMDNGTSTSLDSALSCIKDYHKTDLELRLETDYLTLNGVYEFDGLSAVHIHSSDSGKHTYIQCNSTHESGLIFNNSINITLEGITLSGCGAKHKSTSVNFIKRADTIYTFSAVYFSNSSDIAITNVTINSSDGAGLTMVNCGGAVNITGSKFTNNSIKSNTSIPGGGGVSIELLGWTSLQECRYNTLLNYYSLLSAKYNIQNCLFVNNTASAGKFLITHITSNENYYFTYGQGGGLFIHLGCKASNNTMNVSNNHFKGNLAQRGGGIFIGFRQHSQNNKVTVDNVTFYNNSCLRAKRPPGGNYSSGGGMKVLYYTDSRRNDVLIKGGNFTNNTAYFGGGLSMGGGTNYIDDIKTKNCIFIIEKSHFHKNNARIGAALDLYYRASVQEGYSRSSVIPKIIDTNFTQNGGLYYYSSDDATGRTFATIYIVYIHVDFQGVVNIYNNTASGIGIEEATVQFSESALISLTNNTAKIGGGMAMIGRSTVVVHKNTTVKFFYNFATEKGGAIFVTQSQERYTAYDYTCFIKYSDNNYSVTSSNFRYKQWKATLIFRGNKADSSKMSKSSNNIYTSSLLPCVWPSSPKSQLEDDIKETFCGWGNSWQFYPQENCRDSIETAPSSFTRSKYHVKVVPGNVTKISNFRVCDDLGHDVSSVVYTVSQIDMNHTTIKYHDTPRITVTDEGILVKAKEKYQTQNLTVFVQTADRKSITTKIVVNVLKCQPGYILQKQVCRCDNDHDFKKKVQCNRIMFTSNIFAGYCITFSNVKMPNNSIISTFIVARCPYVVGKLSYLYNLVPVYYSYTPEEEDAFCQPLKRRGKLCGSCQQDYGIDVYSINYQCIKCRNIHLNWLKVIAASTIPTTLLFILCTVFHVSITSAPTNGYIFFSHVITMRLDMLTVRYTWRNLGKDKDTLSDLLYIPYQLWTFDFPQILLNRTCLGKDFKVTHALALQYLSVLYPLLLVLTAILLIELHAKNCKPLVWLWKPLCYICVRFRHSWHIRTTVIDTFASFLLLSYSNLIGVSMSLLAPNSIILSDGTVVGHTLNYDTSVEFFRKTHLKFGVLAIIILCTFGAIPPILLILYPFKWFQYLLNKCRPRGCHFIRVFVDAFQGSYKNSVKGYPERRYFAGVYFLFRIAIKLIYVLVEDMIELHLTLTLTYMFFMLILMAQRPYKKNFYNVLDGVFMSILVTTHAMTVYLLYHAVALGQIPKKVWYFTYAIQHIPTLYMILLVVYLVSFRMRCVKRFFLTHFSGRSLFYKNDAFNDSNSPKSPLINYDWPSSSSLVIPSPSSPHVQARSISDVPDRVENPHRYEPLVDSWQYPPPRNADLQDFSGVVSKNSKNIPNYGSSLN